GINFSLIGAIYDKLNRQAQHGSGTKKRLHTHCSLNSVSTDPAGSLVLEFYHQMQEKSFCHGTGSLILATGYSNFVPAFLEPVKERIQWTADGLYHTNRNYSIDRDNSLFVQNADLHSHGFNSADLGMGAYRNAVIINAMLGREHFKVERNTVFQTFGIPVN
ncbi:MAG: SidA/IucD/PvdA family monooxygenase, partial [Ferruginibacter sp.]